MDDRVVLALDTATEVTVVALGRLSDSRVILIDSEEIDAPRSAMSRLLVAVDQVLERNSYALTEVDEIVVGRGPGSFTGVRIGVATAKGLAHGLGVPLRGVGTLDAVAWRFSADKTLLGVVGDAMRGEVYPALFRCGDGRAERLGPDSVARPEDAARAWREHRGRIVVAGNGLAKHAPVFADALGAESIGAAAKWSPSAEGLLLAHAAARSSTGEAVVTETGDPGELLPIYTRLSDAEENERRSSDGGVTPPSGVAGGSS